MGNPRLLPGHWSSAAWLRLVLVAYVVLGVLYSVATPIFEASDEVWHYGVVRHIALTGQLPVQRVGVQTAWQQEGSQPPLYYWIMSPLAAWLDRADEPRPGFNPHAQPGNPSLEANRNLAIHSSAEDFPWQGVALSVHLIRWLSLGLGAITIILGYAMARRLFPDRSTIPIGTAALIAFNPMFLFIAASVNNDNLIIALTSAAVYLTVVIYQETQLDRAAWLRRIALALLMGAMALSKISGLTALPFIGLMLTIRHVRRREWRAWLITGGLSFATVVVIAGWWYLRNWQLYGDWLAVNIMVAITAARPAVATMQDLLAEFEGFRASYWGLFGAVNITTWPVAYVIYDAFTMVGLIGWLRWLMVRRREREQVILMLLLAGYGALVVVGLIRWTMINYASQGRLIFPAIVVNSLVLWTGWESIWAVGRWAARWRSGVKWALIGFMVLVAAISPVAYIAPVYAGPIVLAPDQVPATITRVEADFGADLHLLGYTAPMRVATDQTAEFTLYWQCLRQPTADLSVFVIVYGRNLSEIGKRDAYPYRGLFGTRQCAAGQIFADPYHVRLQADAVRPTILRVQIGLKDRVHDVELKPSINGQPVSAVVFTAGALSPDRVVDAPQVVLNYRLGDVISLVGYDSPVYDPAAKVVRYRLYWQVANNATPAEDYTLFAHLLDANGAQIGQGDSQPFNGDYPTSMWLAAETIVEERTVAATTPGTQLVLGLYRLADGARLPVSDATGQRVLNDQIILPVK